MVGCGYINHQEYIETNLLRAGEEEKTGPVDSISNLPSVERLKNEGVEEENSVVEEGNVVLAEKESGYSNGTFELVEPARRAYDGSKPERSSSSISSYDESRGFEKIKSITGDVPAIDPCKEEDSLSEFHPAVDLEENFILKQNVHVNMSSRNDSSVASLLVDSARKEKGEKGESCVEQKAGISEDSSSERENDAVVQSVDDRVTLLYNEPSATANGGAENGKHSGVAEPLLAPRQPTQTMSWKSCCGLFAIFTGPGR